MTDPIRGDDFILNPDFMHIHSFMSASSQAPTGVCQCAPARTPSKDMGAGDMI